MLEQAPEQAPEQEQNSYWQVKHPNLPVKERRRHQQVPEQVSEQAPEQAPVQAPVQEQNSYWQVKHPNLPVKERRRHQQVPEQKQFRQQVLKQTQVMFR